MSEILNLGGFTPPVADRIRVDRSETRTPRTHSSFDPHAFPRFDAEVQGVLAQSPFRVARVNAVRAEIESGVYETPERLRGAVERLLDVIA